MSGNFEIFAKRKKGKRKPHRSVPFCHESENRDHSLFFFKLFRQRGSRKSLTLWPSKSACGWLAGPASIVEQASWKKERGFFYFILRQLRIGCGWIFCLFFYSMQHKMGAEIIFKNNLKIGKTDPVWRFQLSRNQFGVASWRFASKLHLRLAQVP